MLAHTRTMDAKLALTGALPFMLIAAALLSVPVCAALLRLYRRSVIAGMAERSGQSAEPPRASGGPVAAPLQVLRLTTDSPVADNPAWRRARRLPWQAAAVYLAAGLAYAIVMAASFLRSAGYEFLPVRTLVLTLSYLWPGVLAVMLVAAYDLRHRLALLAAYVGLIATVFLLASSEPGLVPLASVAQLWWSTNVLPTVLVLAFLWRPVRAVGPLVLSFMVVALMGSQILVSWLQADEAALRTVTSFFFGLGLGGSSTFVLLLVLGMLLASAAGWPLLKLLGRRYQARALSETSLLLDAVFLMFGIMQAIGFVFEGPLWIVAGPVAFAAARTTASLLWRLGRDATAAAPRLLLLRVFSLGARSERLFDRLRRHWQLLGPIGMIAGPDLVTSTVEPHEFLDFVSGNLARQFVTGATDLQGRLAAFDARPAPDGRYRIDELFCRADTWQISMQRLAASSDAVLMDLRSFAPTNQGCRYEIGRLLDSVDLRRVVLLVDKTTDEPYLQSTLQELWQQLAADSPNRRPGVALRVMRIDEPGHAEMAALLGQLLQR